MGTLSEKLVEKWLQLQSGGYFQEAKDYYFESLFKAVIEDFENKTADMPKGGTLFSILGYTPEPIILTQRAILPQKHVIFYSVTSNFESEVYPYLQEYLTSSFELVPLPDTSFGTVYRCLQEQINIHAGEDYYLDITGGKKSMVASAAIFARDYDMNVLYVDYKEYLTDIRRPKPGTEVLNWVYDPKKDLPERLNL